MDNLFIPINVPELDINAQIISDFTPTRSWVRNTTNEDDQLGNLWEIEEVTEITDQAMDENINLKDTHQGLQDWILANLPLTSIVQLYIIKSVQDAPMHMDNTYTSMGEGPENMPSYDSLICSEAYQTHRLSNEPTGYRILISGNKGQKRKDRGIGNEGRDTGFKCMDPDTLETQWATIPADTDVYLIRNYDVLHGVDLEEDETRITAFVSGWLDEAAHADLITTSKTKYADYII